MITLKQMEKDLKIQSDEIIRLNTELKRVTKLKDEMLEALISELEGNFKTDHTFRLIDKAKEQIKNSEY